MSNDKKQDSIGAILKASVLTGDAQTASSSSKASNANVSGLDFIDHDLLSSATRIFIKDCQQLLSEKLDLKLTCLGCYKSEQGWDYRPLFVAKSDLNSLLLFRIIKPATQLNPTLEMAWRSLSEKLPRTYLASGLDDFSKSTSEARIYWSVRKFYPDTLGTLTSAGNLQISNSAISASVEAFLSEIKTLEEILCPHGNLCLSNIGFDGQRLFLLDPWLNSASRKSESYSPTKTLSPRNLASLLLKFFSQLLPDLASQSLVKFISQDSENLSFTELHSAWQSVYSKFDTDHGQASSKLSQSTETLSHAPRGKVISASDLLGKSNQPKDTQSVAGQAIIKPSVEKELQPNLAIDKLPKTLLKLSNKRLSLFFAIALLTASLVLLASGYLNFHYSAYTDDQLAQDWASGDPLAIAGLAKSAIVENDLKAQQYISMKLLAGEETLGADSKFLKMAFNPLWFDQLSDQDRIFALSVALSSIYKTPSEYLPKIEDLHPALLFALLGKLRLSNSDNSVSRLDIGELSNLPGSYGAVFKGLSNLGYSKLGDPAVHAAARIINDNFDLNDIEIALNSEEKDSSSLQTAALIAPFSENNPRIAELIFEQSSARTDQLGTRLRWFAEQSLADWKSLSPKDLLFIALGLIPENLTQLDKLADLLLYPNQRVRQKALEKIITLLKAPELKDLFNMLVVNPAILTRAQAISLVVINQGEPSKASPFVSGWLNLEPDPAVVLEFLLSTSDRKSFDASSVQLANYLARKDFDISQKQLPLLLSHPEALARTLAFPRLDPSRELDRRILTAWLETETSPRIKQEIKQKLENNGQQ